MDLATVLKNAQHPNQDIRRQAEGHLNQAIDAQYGQFLVALASEVANESNDVSNRQLAGLYIKNLLSAQDETILEAKTAKWLQCDAHFKENIRVLLLQSVKSPIPVVAHTSAQALAAFGAVDVPRNDWPALIPTLCQQIMTESDTCKVASLEALGYMCDVMSPDEVDGAVVNQILSAIVVGTAATQANMHIRLAAIKALNNSLDFTSKNFEIAPERDAIMRAVCECTQAPDQKIREVAFECCATVADLYYDKLAPYAEILFNLSTQAIKTDAQEVGMQAIEFWNTVCDQEIGIMEDMEEGVTDIVFLRLIAQAAGGLVPLVLECMTKQEEDADEDTWNISMAAATLLESLALTLLDQVVDLVLPFITQNINNVNWRLKESALMAFGMILDGPSAEKLSPLVIQAMPILITCLKDPKVLVRDTSAWVIGKICELHQSCISGEILPAMVSGLSSALDDQEGKVVSQACYAVHNLAAACADESEANSNVLSHFMPVMLQKLMGITSKSDWESENVRSAAYEAMNMMVENSALDMKPIVSQLLLETLNRLEFTFNPQFNLPDKMNVQSALCSLVGQIVRKLEYTDIAPLTDRILQSLLEVFKTKGAMAHEDALLAMGYLAEKMKENFVRYLQVVQAPLLHGLSNIEEHTVCTAAVGVLGDISRSVGKAVAPYCDEIMKALLVLLQSNTLNRAVKPHVISVFADVAMAIEGDFARYVTVVMGVLKSAGEVTMTTDDEDLVEYINLLRNSILEAYSGIIQGLKEANQQDLMMPGLMGVAEFIQRAGCDSNRSDEVLKSCVGLIGDMGQSYGAKIQSFLQQEFVSKLINDALLGQCNAEEVANWAKSIVIGVTRGK